MRSITKGDLIRPGKTRFATNHIAIDSILKKKSDLRKLFTSSAWNENAASRTRDGQRIEKRVLDGTFWDGMEAVHKIYKSLYKILRIVDTEIQPTMPILYDKFERVKQQISQMRGKKWVLKIINDRWDNTLSQPLHAAAHFLNPNFHYRHDVGYSPRFTNSLATVVEQFNINGEIADTFLDERCKGIIWVNHSKKSKRNQKYRFVVYPYMYTLKHTHTHTYNFFNRKC
ncbi:putative ribonuclease H-like domain-containing protein [Rosa chinensis]|uniref:Putative ribonuclease H-like domain-containing protein n=1 Tax=Rosa chinensis TaxID=74649 RepID=A0A2P6PBQ1_ROSCH|nr:putative ribonuclease H-like domain-containing protein [Rosa chinensis]